MKLFRDDSPAVSADDYKRKQLAFRAIEVNPEDFSGMMVHAHVQVALLHRPQIRN